MPVVLLEQHPLAVVRHEEVSDLVGRFAGLKLLAHDGAHLLRYFRWRVGDRQILADHAAQLAGDGAGLIVEIGSGRGVGRTGAQN
jgi:hypothetical protein